MKASNLFFQKGHLKYLFLLFFILIIHSCKTEKSEYVCTPCDLECDEITFTESGTCPHCKMDLIKKSDITQAEDATLNEINIQTGSGFFIMDDEIGNESKRVKVFYHKPQNFSNNSEILLVIPGAGRNGDTYRDSWIDKSEKYSLLILSPMYPKEKYSFDEYHLGGLIKNSNLNDCIERVENTNKIKLFEEKLTFDSNPNANEWLFNDFDRIFDNAVEVLNSNQTTYNLFGHSAGGHILHRFTLFQKNSKASKVLASNASFYTLPSFDDSYPFGLNDTPVDEVSLKNAFKKNLVIFLGELDNENETGGSFLQSKSADKQGYHRLERGKFFYNKAKEVAKKLDTEFNWELKIVPRVGHNYRLMGDAAGDYLYQK